ncbi:MAG TPA: anthranilate phosphoribosyltransferase [Fimbriimonadaceae bacterium]
MPSFTEILTPLLEGQNLSFDQARELMAFLTSGEASEGQIGSALTALKIKGATATELAGFSQVMRDNAHSPAHSLENLVDTCGTGGGVPSFNISTASSFVAAAAGVKIAKHGNRGVTSAYGSADVLETLGAKVQTEWDVLVRMLSQTGIGFMFAPAHHPAMRHVGKTRKDLGFRTVFNQLGPLANPAGAKSQLIGVYDPTLAFPMAEALMKLGTERALIAHGEDGLDEVSPVTPTRFALLWDGELSEGILSPSGFGLKPVSPHAVLPGDSAQANAELMLEAITDSSSERSTAILPSAACAIWIAGITPDRKSAAELAREVVRSGAAREKLESFIKESNTQ